MKWGAAKEAQKDSSLVGKIIIVSDVNGSYQWAVAHNALLGHYAEVSRILFRKKLALPITLKGLSGSEDLTEALKTCDQSLKNLTENDEK